MKKALASVSFLLLAACQSGPLHRQDSGTKSNEGDTQSSDVGTNESCGDLQSDNNNCGRCGNVCSAITPSTAQCVAGRCLTTLVTQDRVPSIVVARTGIYWLNIVPAADVWSSTALWRSALEGGAPTILTTKCGSCYETGQPNAKSVSCSPFGANDKTIYCATSVGSSPYIDEIPMEGGSAHSLLEDATSLGIEEIALDSSNVYWTTCYKDSYVKRASLGEGSEPTDVAWNGPYCPSNLVRHDSSLYWLGNKDPGAYRDTTSLLKISVTQNGAKPIPLLDWNKNWGRFVVGDSAIYWFDADQGAVTALPLNGGNASTVITGLDSVRDLIADVDHLYWASYDAGKIMKLSLNDGALTVLATGQSRPHGLVVDASSVYWISTDNGQDTVSKLSPK
jgi:hypothetical protein